MYNSHLWFQRFRDNFIPAIQRVEDVFLLRLQPTFLSIEAESEKLENDLWEDAMSQPYYSDYQDEGDIGDCEQLSSSNWRNQAYTIAKLVMNGDAKAYDFAQVEEVMRLAYVAITRAKLHCYWFLDAPKPGGKGFPKASAQIDKRQWFFSDHRR